MNVEKPRLTQQPSNVARHRQLSACMLVTHQPFVVPSRLSAMALAPHLGGKRLGMTRVFRLGCTTPMRFLRTEAAMTRVVFYRMAVITGMAKGTGTRFYNVRDFHWHVSSVMYTVRHHIHSYRRTQFLASCCSPVKVNNKQTVTAR